MFDDNDKKNLDMASSDDKSGDIREKAATVTVCILLGYDERLIRAAAAVFDKVAIFDDDDESEDARRSYEQHMHPMYGDVVTFYEGNVECNVVAYLRARSGETFTVVAKGAATIDATPALWRRQK